MVRKVGPFRCATMLLCGSYAHLGQAYEALNKAIAQAGIKPTAEARDYYLYEEGDDSPNNVTMVQMGIQ